MLAANLPEAQITENRGFLLRPPVFPCRSARPCPSCTDMAERKISDVLAKPDAAVEMTLRPSLFSEFVGLLKITAFRPRPRLCREVG